MKIILVDDDPIITDTLEMLLEDDYEIITENHPLVALDIIKSSHDIDLIISDQKMPGMSGTELLKLIKEEKPNIKRLILTGYGERDELTTAIREKIALKIILKPWDPDILKTIIGQTLNN